MALKLWTLLFFFGISTSLFSQTIEIKLVDADTKEALVFANCIFSNNSQLGCSTNQQGVFILNLKNKNFLFPQDTLICTYLGYEDLKIPINLTQPQKLTYKMQSNSVALTEIEVMANAKNYTGLEIVKKALKAKKQNYNNKPVYLKGFYRELVYENDKCIQLNEAFTKIHYVGYQHKRNAHRKLWKHYWKDAKYGAFWDYGYGKYLFPQSQSFYYYNAVNDQAEIVASRASENWSVIGMEPAPRGGPLNLIAADKVKLQYDFFDKKNFDKYSYNFDKAIYRKGVLCYVVSFFPLATDKKVYQTLNKKVKHAIYAGQLYVDVNTFAVVGFECQTSEVADMSRYKEHLRPYRTEVKVDYKNMADKWYVDKVLTKQYNRCTFRGKEYNYTCTRELNIDSVITNNVSLLPSDNLLEFKFRNNLRLFQDEYDDNKWQELEKQWYYPPLQQKDLQDLEKSVNLVKQIEERFIRKELPDPKVSLSTDTLWLHGDTLIDEYHMRNIDAYATKDHLRTENDYFRNYLIPSRVDRKKFYRAANAIVKSDSLSNQFNLNGIQYFWNDESILYRYTATGTAEAVFNPVNSEDTNGYRFAYFDVDPTNQILLKGLKHLDSIGMKIELIDFERKNKIFEIKNVYDLQWVSDTTCIYSIENESRRVHQLFYLDFKNNIRTQLLEEKDRTFDIEFSCSIQDSMLLVHSESANEMDVYFSKIIDQKPILKKLTPSQKGHKYFVQYCKGIFYIQTNFEAPNFRVMSTSTSNTKVENWKTIIEEQPGISITDLKKTKNYLVIKTITDSESKLASFDIRSRELKPIVLEDKYLSLFISNNSYTNDKIKIQYSSPRIPDKSIYYNLASSDTTVVSQLQIKDEMDTEIYEIKKVLVSTEDKEQIPLTIYFNKQTNNLHKGLILKVYGAYSGIRQPEFNLSEMVMMDKGFSFAIAHVRGGGAKGDQWYNEGKLLSKINSMTDYIACAEYLISNGYTTKDFLVSYGQSAAGIIQGYVINERPDLFKAMILDYPYLDVINTMRDLTLPLTAQETKEWGSLENIEQYKYIKSYSPYQQIKSNRYPNLLFYAGYKDFQTPYWQIAKHVLKLRDNNTGTNKILLSTNLTGGHFQDKNILQKESNNYAFIVESLFGSQEKFNALFEIKPAK